MDFDEKATRDYLRELILNLYSISEELNDETELVASGIIDSFGIVRVIQDERYVGYSKEDNLEIIEFYIMCPIDKKEATIGNGTMISFDGKTPEKVNEFHQKALYFHVLNFMHSNLVSLFLN